MSDTDVAWKIEYPLDDLLGNELLCIADSTMILAHWYIKVLPNGRSIPDFLAIAAMAQDELGAARGLYEVIEGKASNTSFEDRVRGEEIRSMAVLDNPPSCWVDFVVTAYLVERAVLGMLSTFEGGKWNQLTGFTRKLKGEARYHLLQTQGWFQSACGTDPDAVASSLRERLPVVVEWFGPDRESDELAQVGFRTVSVVEAARQLIDSVAGEFEGWGVDVPVSAPSWKGWSSTRRRCSGCVPEELMALVVGGDHYLRARRG